jgi:hypothetical protein
MIHSLSAERACGSTRTATARPAAEARMFDSPFERCPHCRQYVLLDQTQRQCAREHGCGEDTACPLARYFTGIEFGDARPGARAAPAEALRRRDRRMR